MKFPSKSVMPRYFLVVALMCLLGLIVLWRAGYIMFVERDFWLEAGKHYVRTNRTLPATRGNILADDGQVLAASIPEYKMFMDFMSWEKKDTARRDREQHWRDSVLTADLPAIAAGMKRLFPEIDTEEFIEHMKEGRRQKSHHWPVYPKRVSYIQYCEVKKLPLFSFSSNRGGFHVEDFQTRKNPYGRLAARTIGDLYKGIDSARCGIELSFDSILRGKPGSYRRQKVRGRFIPFVERPAEDGLDVQTTLNVNMQDICEKALGDQLKELKAEMGVCILMEVATGDIKAITSLTRQADESYRETWPYAVSGLYEPGSVFKPMSFMVAMDDGYLKTTDQVDVGNGIKEMYGRFMRDHNWRSGGYGILTVPQVLQKSSNIGVSHFIDKFYHEQPEKFVDGLYRIGVAEDLKVPIPGAAKPRIRRPLPDGSNWSRTALPWMSIGYETQMPPLSTLNFYNGVANGGKLLRPRLVKAIMKDGQVVREFPVTVLREQMAKPEVIKDIQDILESVVSVGLGKKAGSPQFHVSGKTGTAQIWTKAGFSSQYLISFAGYFPSEKPLYSCIVCIQKHAPASGGGHCGPVFRRVAEMVMAQRFNTDYSAARDTLHAMGPVVWNGNLTAAAEALNSLGVAYTAHFESPTGEIVWGHTETIGNSVQMERDETQPDVMPDLEGYGLRDAVFRLEKMGLRVKATGVGHVTKQSRRPGEKTTRGETVELTLTLPQDIRKKATKPAAAVPPKPKGTPASNHAAAPTNDSVKRR